MAELVSKHAQKYGRNLRTETTCNTRRCQIRLSIIACFQTLFLGEMTWTKAGFKKQVG